MRILVSLVGEQPIPNLLAIRAEQPDAVLLVYSTQTKDGAERLRELPNMPEAIDCPTEAFNLPAIRSEIERVIRVRRWSAGQLVFNLTGGTKAMALAAYEVAKALGAPFLYLQSEGKRSLLYRYRWASPGAPGGESLPDLESQAALTDLITVDEYVRAYVGKWWHDDRKRGDAAGHRFEELVKTALLEEHVVDELEADVRWSEALEADLIMRLGSNFAVAEIKQGKESGKKTDLQQLAMITRQQVFGTYVQPLFILGKRMDYNNRTLAESFGITIIELPSWESTQDLSPADRSLLRTRVREALTAEGDAA